MSEENTSQRLAAAEINLTRTVQRLRELQRAALYGRYSVPEFDEAVTAYRAARQEAYDARNAWAAHYHQQQQQNPQQSTAIAPPKTDVDVPLAITPKLLFAQWLVKTGRVTEWPDG